jgi:isopentenyl diphosphate isomerase/L-lactate dehydrogenase-like FMN-dependent dehydrogenase
MAPFDREQSRRKFLQFLAGSPLFALAGGEVAAIARMLERGAQGLPQSRQDPALIKAAQEALNVFDFEPVAKAKLPVAHWGYLATGTDDDATLRANREGYTRWELKVRRLVDVSRIDPGVDLLGTSWPTPIVINPVGSQRAFHAEGELATARAAKARNHLQVLSTVATTSIEEVSAARGMPVWYQLYHRADWSQTRELVKRVERAGCPVLVFTVDLLGGSNRETQVREAFADTRDCTKCHTGGRPRPGMVQIDLRDNRRKPMISGFGPAQNPDPGTPTWDYIKRLKDTTTMKVFLKGIVTREDAELAMQQGVDGLFVSNHGGRAENSGRATISSLPEVVAGVAGRAPVILDGGIRRGTDIFKALALGATATGIGRPYIWGLASFGQEGVETVLALLRKEFETVMRQAGTISTKHINRDYVAERRT